jgi:hypothetical protein
MISGLFSCSEKAIETDLYGTRSDIRNGRHSGRQFRKIQAESKVKSRGRANSESIPSPPLFRLQREISGVLYLQRIAVISSDTAIFADPLKTHADMRIPTQT